MKYRRPTAEMKCVVCGKSFLAERSRVINGARKCCSRSCRGRIAVAFRVNLGRPPEHGACVGGELKPLYKRWSGIRARCHSPRSAKYKNYGARGITMCQEWLDSYPAFESWALAHGFSPELQIDRIDNDKGYTPENCRWVTPLENAANRRSSIIFPSGETTAQVARRLGISANALRMRLSSGMTMEKAMTLKFTPNGGLRKHFRKHHPEIGQWEEPAPGAKEEGV